MSRYLPLCDYMSLKAGGSKSLWTAFNAAAGLTIGIAANIALALQLDSHIGAAAVNGMFLSSIGLSLAIQMSDYIIPRILNAMEVGVRRGGQIVRASQLISYALPVIASLHLTYDEAMDRHKISKSGNFENSYHQNVNHCHLAIS